MSAMIKKKKVTGTDKVMSVTFELRAPEGTQTVAVLGDWNGWQPEKQQMKRRKDGLWAVTLRLPANQDFQYIYVVDGHRWVADADAERHVPNAFGGANAVLRLH
jgi:1,4-alpha-glucan branching enzyme